MSKDFTNIFSKMLFFTNIDIFKVLFINIIYINI
jgi:hypothetical protein